MNRFLLASLGFSGLFVACLASAIIGCSILAEFMPPRVIVREAEPVIIFRTPKSDRIAAVRREPERATLDAEPVPVVLPMVDPEILPPLVTPESGQIGGNRVTVTIKAMARQRGTVIRFTVNDNTFKFGGGRVNITTHNLPVVITAWCLRTSDDAESVRVVRRYELVDRVSSE